ncbi:MAG: Fic family protein [Syntrophomonadaceae bacterium]|nr:Fic family protein [Syntrophomonadaceae bacterium]MDD4548522.1 Fic family protein [Syntrophomonadaceae bacterium]
MDIDMIKYIKEFTDERYLNKKEVMYRLPAPLTINDFWPTLLEHRKQKSIETIFEDQRDRHFWFVLTEEIRKRLELIENEATKNTFSFVDKQTQHEAILNALIDEAFFSSVIEGAFSTKKKTAEMINKKLKPKDKSEQMILNNYFALEYILENLSAPIDEYMILKIYNIVTENTLAPDDIVEKYRNDYVYVMNNMGDRVIYQPPHHSQVQNLINELVAFINTDDGQHPIIKACIIHFYFVYIHPFFDGNGRTARAISYMYLLKNGYNFFKFFSISSVINSEKQKYYKALKDTEDYEADLTYFIDFYSRMILNSIARIEEKFAKEFHKKVIQVFLDRQNIALTKRQRKFIEFSIRSNKHIISIEEYQKKFKVSYETARTDLNHLTEYGLLKKSKQGKKYIYRLADYNEISAMLEE